ncbi:2-succinyl-6-hydroxy-2,4-cyclohexadiene-1-carboxylate synthase [Salipaludibacillus keqinensis]|uniref:2-succinyl-6-hydroxy-2, 4-cyclohexadiene-1-carboxylate synthase n=1 Tax=Salipaludibacillus keqinensis TaxID=2045207 RepID=A0A323TEZ0_9BACI|nr:alpha/beta hydrolase [Salipaludibacillus keqinensis]PYZ93160.1 2-succinyl-6-hydroxy-2,4-cyclohexadiene-1-carboxylate synthase [Salipaludibacillus keqinensis]
MLHYREFIIDSSQPWVTFIHGAGGNSNTWFKQLKEYKKHFNVLLIDLRGHGRSSEITWKKGDTFEEVATEVIHVLDHLKLRSSHFIGISLGTIIIQTIAQKYPNRIDSMILGGAIIKLNIRTKFLISLGSISKYFIPYMWLYRFLAWIIMPKSNHLESRIAFVNQAKKMCQKEFIRWFTLTKALNPLLNRLQNNFNQIPTLFVMGDEDYLFLPSVKKLVEENKDLSFQCIKDSGHVCNIDQPELFNEVTINYIQDNTR